MSGPRFPLCANVARLVCAAALGLGLLWSSDPARAAGGPNVFVSPGDIGVNIGCPSLSTCDLSATGQQTLFLYADPTITTACGEGEGECPPSFCSDVCAIDALIEIENGVFDEFDAESGIVFNPVCSGEVCELPAGTTRIRMVGTWARQSSQSGPRRLGSVRLTANAGPTSVALNGVEMVNANVVGESLPVRIIALPEPGQLVLLGTGLLSLAALSRLRGKP